MNRMSIVVALLAGGALSACGLGGCAVAQYTEIGPQSHFIFPNSNVKALGPVKVKVPGRSTWGMPPVPDSGDHLRAYNAALQQVEGANLIIDYVKIIKLYGIPILYVYWSEIELEGTAAKMEVGKQVLQ